MNSTNLGVWMSLQVERQLSTAAFKFKSALAEERNDPNNVCTYEYMNKEKKKFKSALLLIIKVMLTVLKSTLPLKIYSLINMHYLLLNFIIVL
jgi:hypothetical protein